MANHNLRILSLRTCKADVAVGLEQSDVDRLVSIKDIAYHSLELEMPDWRVNGKCAMISFWDKNPVNARWN